MDVCVPSTVLPSRFFFTDKTRTIKIGDEDNDSSAVDVLLSEVGIVTILRHTSIGGGPWRLSQHLVVEIRWEGSRVLAIQHDVDEYGIGQTSAEAIEDLLLSLLDYRTSLEKRVDTLAAKERDDLTRLNTLLER